ncbi:unnamed protein product [Danaus chrysippus]|uniref:(African queen) hypothetical protein n=1 Tax=Danaus chrysippus TaxID=151541 RepID=A0A8J2VXI4_9NEOP|nr:unnamed protein product [Danaus chrysippus]
MTVERSASGERRPAVSATREALLKSESLRNDRRSVRYNQLERARHAAERHSPLRTAVYARLGALRTPVSEVIAASPADQSGARADERAAPLEGPEPRASPPAEFEDPNLAGAPRPRSRESGRA